MSVPIGESAGESEDRLESVTKDDRLCYSNRQCTNEAMLIDRAILVFIDKQEFKAKAMNIGNRTRVGDASGRLDVDRGLTPIWSLRHRNTRDQ